MNDYNQFHLHPLDVVMGAFNTAIGIIPTPGFSFILRDLETLTALELDNSEETIIDRFYKTCSLEIARNLYISECVSKNWIPTSEYMEVTRCILQALEDVNYSKWSNPKKDSNLLVESKEDRDNIIFSLRWWYEVLRTLRQGNMQEKIFYRGLYMPLTILPCAEDMLTHSEDKFMSMYTKSLTNVSRCLHANLNTRNATEFQRKKPKEVI